MKKIVFVLALMCLSFSALADVYAVHNIHVDTTAENATKAKEQGIAAAQEKAFYKMLERLTLVKDLDSLPVLSTEDILNLVRDFSVSHEKTSSVRYIADVDVQFNANAVQNFFQTNRLPYVNVVAEKSLIFPVYRTPDEVLLWKDANAADGDGETGDDTSDGGSADGDGSEENPVDPEKADSPAAFLKW